MPVSPSRPLSALWAAAAALLLAAPAAADHDGSYGYFRVIEGSATVTQAGSGTRAAAELNQPVLAGDRLWVPRNGRLEVVLSDRNLLRVDGDTELLFERLADSPEANDRQTVLRLLEGNVQLVAWSGGRELPRIDTPNATIYVQDEGVYRIGTGDQEWTEVVVREGHAEVVTERGSVVVREDEQAWVDGVRDPEVDVQAAGSRDALERWARRLDDEYEADRYASYVDEDLRYQAAPLRRHGTWVNYNRSWVWRPHVGVGWRPYHYGRWAYTPAGYFWVTAETWGWVPYHYGTWDYIPVHGWVWYPGRAFAPAWVYWYWGPSYVGWCPVGYYTHWYSPWYHDYGFRRGVYGWVGGDWGHYANWNFVPYGHFGRRDLHNWARAGRDLRDTRPGGLGRGILTTDTRSITPERLGDPRGVQEVLRRRDVVPRGGGDLPDVTPFIERRENLPPEVRRTVVTRDAPEGSPMRPQVVVERRGGVEGGTAEGRRVAGRDGGEPGASDGPRAVPVRPAAPPTDSGGEAWRVRGRDRGDSGAGGDEGPRVVPARPASPPSDSGGEAWRVRNRDRNDSGDSGADDGPRVVPDRPASPPSDSGGESRRVRERDRNDSGDSGADDGPRAVPARPSPPESDSGGNEGWRERDRGDEGDRGEADRPRDKPADREPPAERRSLRHVAPERQARPQSNDDQNWRARARDAIDRSPSVRAYPTPQRPAPSTPPPSADRRPSYHPPARTSPPAGRSGSYSPPAPRPAPSAPPRASSPPSSGGGQRSVAPRSRGSDSPPSSSGRQPRSRPRGDGGR